MSIKITITADINVDSLEDQILYDCEEAVLDTLNEWGLGGEISSKKE